MSAATRALRRGAVGRADHRRLQPVGRARRAPASGRTTCPPAPSGKRCSSTGRPPMARSSGSRDRLVVADEVELGLAPLGEEHLVRAGSPPARARPPPPPPRRQPPADRRPPPDRRASSARSDRVDRPLRPTPATLRATDPGFSTVGDQDGGSLPSLRTARALSFEGELGHGDAFGSAIRARRRFGVHRLGGHRRVAAMRVRR